MAGKIPTGSEKRCRNCSLGIKSNEPVVPVRMIPECQCGLQEGLTPASPIAATICSSILMGLNSSRSPGHPLGMKIFL